MSEWAVFLIDGFATGTSSVNGINVILINHQFQCPSNNITNAIKIVNNFDDSILNEGYTISIAKSISEAISINSNGRALGTWPEEAQRLAFEKISEVGELNHIKYGATLLLLNNVKAKTISRIHMPDGTDGLNCLKCDEYYPYVEQNCDEGFICRKHQM